MSGSADTYARGGQDKPNQTRLTPAYILDIVRKLGPILLDPCAAVGSLVQAENEVFFPDMDGLYIPWHACGGLIFVNPPFCDLKAWLAKALAEQAIGAEIVMLCPVRTRRVWWRLAAARAEVYYLNPVSFHGEKGSLMEDCCLMYFSRETSRGEGFRYFCEVAGCGGFL